MSNEFKSLFMLDPDVTYFNHGAYGGCPKEIFNVMLEWQNILEINPSKYMDELFENLENSRVSLSKYIDCNKNDIVFFANPTTAMNTVVKNLNLNPGDEILSTDHEYGAMNITWNYICEKTGAKFIPTKIPAPYVSKEHFINAIEKNITPKTKMIFLSHITSSTALIFPVKEICELAKKYNILSFVDGAHAPAQIPVSIKEINPDYYAGACHKWMCSPKGVSFLYVKNNLQHMIDPLVVSWGYEAEEPGKSQFLDYHQWQGTRDMSAYLTIPKTIEFLHNNKWNDVASKCRKINLWAREEINNLLDNEPLCDNKFLGQMSSIYLDFKNPIQTQIDFYKKYNIQIPFMIWNEISLIRISIQAYNKKEDVFKLLDALKKEYC